MEETAAPESGDETGRRHRPPRLLWRLAVSDVFSRDDEGKRPPLLTRAMSVTPGWSGRERRKAARRRISWWRVFLAGLAIVAFVMALGSGAPHMIALNDVQRRLILLSGAVTLAAAMFWPYVHAFGRKMDTVTYAVLLLTFAAALKAQDIVSQAYESRIHSPELSHVVAEVEDARNLTEAAMKQLDARLLKAGFKAPAPAGEKGPRKHAFLYGRRVIEVSINRAEILPGGEEAGGVDVACSEEQLNPSVDMLAASMDEPFIPRLKFYRGSVPGHLAGTAYHRPEYMKNNNNVHAIFITRGLARQLAGKLKKITGQDVPIGAGGALCLDVNGKMKKARVAGIVESLPEGVRGRHYGILAAPGLAGEKRWGRQKYYPLAAIYTDGQRLESFMRFVQKWKSRGVKVRPLPGKRRKVTLRLDMGDAFTKINDALVLSSVFNQAAEGAVVIIIFLTIAMTGISAHSYILRNERSLCVMRAFGIGAPGIWFMMLLQFAMLLAAPLAFVLAMTHGIWPAMAADVARAVGLQEQAVAMSWGQSAWFIFLFLSIIVIGCGLATLYWWWNSRWIAERLKEIG